MADAPALFRSHRERVRPEWLDGNGHMNVAYFGLVFDRAGHALLEALGIGADYVAARRRGLFVVENHCVFEREAHLDDDLVVTSRLLGLDHKRLHLFHELMEPTAGARLATLEVMALQVDLQSRRAVAFEDDVFDRLSAIADGHSRLPRPEVAGRAIGLFSKRDGITQ
jgi:acyl-CoA thioester hydrolase